MFLLLFFLMMMRMTQKIFVMMFPPPPLLMTILMKMTGRNSIKNTREVRMVFASQSFFGMLELFDHRVDFLQNYKTMRVVIPSLEWQLSLMHYDGSSYHQQPQVSLSTTTTTKTRAGLSSFSSLHANIYLKRDIIILRT